MRRGLLLILTLSLLASTPAQADSLTYVNSRFGTTITFPAELFDTREELPVNGDGMTWSGPGGLELSVYGSFNALEMAPAEYLSWSLENLTDAEKVTYSRAGQDWVVVSGLVGQTVFYERFVFGNEDVIHAMRLTYPTSRKSDIDPLVGPIAKSLSGP